MAWRPRQGSSLVSANHEVKPQPVPKCPAKKRKRVVSRNFFFLLTINLQSQQLWKAKLISLLKDEEEEGRAGRKFRDNTVLESLREHGFEPMTFR